MADWEMKRSARSGELRAAALKRRSERLRIGSLVMVTVLIVAAALSTGYATANEPLRTVDVKVMAGDSLWSIAAEHGPSHMDTYEVVREITRINGLDGSLVVAGQVIEVPAGS